MLSQRIHHRYRILPMAGHAGHRLRNDLRLIKIEVFFIDVIRHPHHITGNGFWTF